jgi:hypothetical protein
MPALKGGIGRRVFQKSGGYIKMLIKYSFPHIPGPRGNYYLEIKKVHNDTE